MPYFLILYDLSNSRVNLLDRHLGHIARLHFQGNTLHFRLERVLSTRIQHLFVHPGRIWCPINHGYLLERAFVLGRHGVIVQHISWLQRRLSIIVS